MCRWLNVLWRSSLEPTSHVDVRRRMRNKSVADECRLNRDTRALCTCGERVIVRHPPSTGAHSAHGRHLLSWAIPRDTWPQKLVPCVTSHSGLHTLNHDIHGYRMVRHSLGRLSSELAVWPRILHPVKPPGQVRAPHVIPSHTSTMAARLCYCSALISLLAFGSPSSRTTRFSSHQVNRSRVPY